MKHDQSHAKLENQDLSRDFGPNLSGYSVANRSLISNELRISNNLRPGILGQIGPAFFNQIRAGNWNQTCLGDFGPNMSGDFGPNPSRDFEPNLSGDFGPNPSGDFESNAKGMLGQICPLALTMQQMHSIRWMPWLQ